MGFAVMPTADLCSTHDATCVANMRCLMNVLCAMRVLYCVLCCAVPSHLHVHRYVPIIAGSAVGRKADSRKTVKARGQFQTFDTKRGWVENQARCVLILTQGVR